MEQEKVNSIIEKNNELEKNLTKRNEQYVFDLKKSLTAANLSEDEQAEALQEILPELITGQKTGKTARQLFGTVSERTQSILATPQTVVSNQNFWITWLDTSLVMFSFLSVILSILPLLSKSSQTANNGLITLIVIACSGGLVMMLMDKYIYQYDRPGADKGKKPGFFKSMLILVGAVLVWVVVYTLSMMIPPAINIILDPIVAILLGALAFGAHYLVKKKYGTRGFFTAR